MADRHRRAAESRGGEVFQGAASGIDRVHQNGGGMPPDRAHPRPVAVGLAGPAVFGMGDRNEVVDEEGRADIPPRVQPVEAAGVVEAQVRRVEIERVPRQGGDRPAPQGDGGGGPRLDPAPFGGGARIGRGAGRRIPGRSRGGRIAAARREPAVDRVRRRRSILDPAGGHGLDDRQCALAIEDPRAVRRGDDAEAGGRTAEEGARVGEVDAVDPGRARMTQARDEAREIEGDRSVRHDPQGRRGRTPPVASRARQSQCFRSDRRGCTAAARGLRARCPCGVGV